RSAGDDLKRIRGIGPTLEKRLHGAGVFTFRQIAGWSKADVERLAAGLGRSHGRILRDDWIGQARRLGRRQTP
ncbi:MAG: NADH:ubiquinone oxidoreductase, partial [Acidobacteria bacterium]